MKEMLFSACRDFAIQMLDTHGEFHPFAFGILEDQKTMVSVIGEESDEELLSGVDAIKSLETAYQILHKDHHFVAVSICVDVLINDNENGSKIDAIEIRLDVKGQRTNYYIPYVFDDKMLQLLTPYEREGSFIFFPKEPLPEESEQMVFTLKNIFEGIAPILYIVHDEENYWQFLDGEAVSEDDLMMVKLSEILERDPSVAMVLELPKGQEVFRESSSSGWKAVGEY